MRKRVTESAASSDVDSSHCLVRRTQLSSVAQPPEGNAAVRAVPRPAVPPVFSKLLIMTVLVILAATRQDTFINTTEVTLVKSGNEISSPPSWFNGDAARLALLAGRADLLPGFDRAVDSLSAADLAKYKVLVSKLARKLKPETSSEHNISSKVHAPPDDVEARLAPLGSDYVSTEKLLDLSLANRARLSHLKHQLRLLHTENTTSLQEDWQTFIADAVDRQKTVMRDRNSTSGYAEASCRSGICGNPLNISFCDSIRHAPPGRLANLPADPNCERDAKTKYALLARRQYMQECVPYRLQLRGTEHSGFVHELLGVNRNLQLVLAGGSDIFSPLPGSMRGWSSEWWCGDDKSWSCMFEPFSACESSYTGSTCKVNVPENLPYSEKCLCGFCNGGEDEVWNVLQDGFHDRGQFWAYATNMNWLWRPVPAVQEIVDTVAQVSGLTDLLNDGVGVIAIHVRGMDACNDGRVCLPLDEYFNKAMELASEYPDQRLALFVASDNQTVVEECILTPPERLNGMQCIAAGGFNRTLLDPKIYGARHIEDAQHHASQKGVIWDPATFGIMTIVEMELLARCHALIGTFHSTMDVAVIGLMLARRHVLPPYYSFESTKHLRKFFGENRGVLDVKQ